MGMDTWWSVVPIEQVPSITTLGDGIDMHYNALAPTNKGHPTLLYMLPPVRFVKHVPRREVLLHEVGKL